MLGERTWNYPALE